MTQFTRPVCSECGSSDVLADAYAVWNHVSQTWELQNTFDKGAVCNRCGGETRMEFEPLTGDELDEARAYHLATQHGWQEGDEDTFIEFCDTEDLDYTKPLDDEETPPC